ncbi:MAG: DUF91 domain-containing protein [Blastochloris sp.]|nr:DUF91 domain-containing protein [Blastochloris sp.]
MSWKSSATPAVLTPTSALEHLRRTRQERAIEDLLFSHPGLIDPRLAHPKRQVTLSKDSRADLLFEVGHLFILVEIKRDIIRPASLSQIQRYAARLQKAPSRLRGYLVAPEITAAALKALKQSPFPLVYRRLGVDIPTTIKVCRQCRHAYDARLHRCPRDGQTQVL